MADDDNSKGGKKKLLLILIAVVVAVLLGAGGAVFLLGGSSEGSGEGGAENAPAPVVQAVPGQAMPNAPQIFYIKFENPFITTLNTRPRQRMVQIYVAVSTNSEADMELAHVHTLLIKSIISETFSSVDPKFYNHKEGRAKIKQLCLDRIQDALRNETGSPVVDRVLFTGFVMQ